MKQNKTIKKRAMEPNREFSEEEIQTAKSEMIEVDNDVAYRKVSFTAGRNTEWYSHYGNQCGGSLNSEK